MAAMSTAERVRAWAQFQRDGNCPGAIGKADLQAAVDAVDDWVETNAVAYNLALPLAFRTAATAAQKALLLTYVLERRNGRLATAEG